MIFFLPFRGRNHHHHYHIIILLKGRIYVFHVVSLPLSPEYSGLCVKTSILSLVGQFGNFVFSVFTLAENIFQVSGSVPTACVLRSTALAGHEVSRTVSCVVAKHADETAYLGLG